MPNPKLETYKNKATGTVYDYTDAAAQAALAGILDGTDIESFEDVETALATKVDKVTGKGLSTNDYDNTAKGIVDNIQSNVIANTKLIKDTVGWSGKNKLSYDQEIAGTTNNVTFVENSDGSITISTTNEGASAQVTKILHDYIFNSVIKDTSLDGKQLILSGCPIGGTSETYYMQFFHYDGSRTILDYGNGSEAFTVETIGKTGYQNVAIIIRQGTIITTPITFKPMLRDADILDDTYEPYFGSTAFPRSEQAVLGAKNLLENTATSQSVNGVEYVVNADGTVTANNKATANATLRLNKIYNLPSGTYKYTGCPSGGGSSTYQGWVGIRNAGDTAWLSSYTDTGSGVEFTVDASQTSYVQVEVEVRNNYTADNLLFYPMIRLATDTDPTYAPFAMTNRELTDKVQGIINAASNAADFAAFKTAIGNL